jgi:ribonuclease BN (tRNA processing enzyme)
MQELEVTFYGCRGSYPVSHKQILKYGGNTSSILLESGDKTVILDAGTGIINFGNDIEQLKDRQREIDIFLTHLHLDHIQGLPFFLPMFDEAFTINLYSPRYDGLSVKEAILSLFNHPLSPISNNGIKAHLEFIELDMNRPGLVRVGRDLEIAYIKEASHPISGVLIYRCRLGGKQLVFATDVESPNGFDPEVSDFISGADVLIHDSQYFDDDYYGSTFPKKGFGHSTHTMAVQNARQSEAKKLFLFHHNPVYTDADLERMLAEARTGFGETYLSEEMKKITLRS